MKIGFASDHAGFHLKSILLNHCKTKLGIEAIDFGTANGDDSVDYPDFAALLAGALQAEDVNFGVLVCGTGIGISIAANRFMHVRAALVHDVTSSRFSRQHNNANILVLGGRIIGEEVAKDCLDVFLQTAFEGGRHERRVQKLGILSKDE